MNLNIKEGSIYFFQEHYQRFIRIISINSGIGMIPDTKGHHIVRYITYCESVRLTDLLDPDFCKSAPRNRTTFEYILYMISPKSVTKVGDICVFSEIPKSILDKVQNGIIDDEVRSCGFLTNGLFSNPIHDIRDFRIYQVLGV